MNNIIVNPEKILIYHVGGVGEYGPAELILHSVFKEEIALVLFEARGENQNELEIHHQHEKNGVETFVISRCISDSESDGQFHVNKEAVSSSMFKANPEATKMHLEGYPGEIRTWKDNTELKSTISVKNTTIDKIISTYESPIPDVLSMDAQGAEYKILSKSLSCLAGGTTCVISEIEHYEIYKGQSLFSDQFDLLSEHNFRLLDFLNEQYWHPEMVAGKGFLTVGEAVFFKDFLLLEEMLKEENGVSRLLKYAAISYCMKRYSMCYYIIEILLKNDRMKEVESFVSRRKCYQKIISIHRFIKENASAYLTNKRFFLENLPKEHQDYVPKRKRVSELIRIMVPPILWNLIGR